MSTPDSIVPAQPDTPGVPFPRLAEDAQDDVLSSTPVSSRSIRPKLVPPSVFGIVVLLLVRLAGIALSVLFLLVLRHDAKAFWAPDSTLALGDARTANFAANVDRFVTIDGVLDARSAVDYRRPFERDVHRVGALVYQPEVLVDVPLPADLAHYVPDLPLAGRLVSLDAPGIQYRQIRPLFEHAKKQPTRAKYLLEVGATKASHRFYAWMFIALAALFVLQLWWLVKDGRSSLRAFRA